MHNRYSLWLVPAPETSESKRLEDLIQEYSETYDTPEFKPHLTVTGGVEADRKRRDRKHGSWPATIAL